MEVEQHQQYQDSSWPMLVNGDWPAAILSNMVMLGSPGDSWWWLYNRRIEMRTSTNKGDPMEILCCARQICVTLQLHPASSGLPACPSASAWICEQPVAVGSSAVLHGAPRFTTTAKWSHFFAAMGETLLWVLYSSARSARITAVSAQVTSGGATRLVIETCVGVGSCDVANRKHQQPVCRHSEGYNWAKRKQINNAGVLT